MTAIKTAQVTRLEGDYCTVYLDECGEAREDITLIAFAAQLSDSVTLTDLIRFHHGLAEIIEALKKIYQNRTDEDYPEADHARCIACERPYASPEASEPSRCCQCGKTGADAQWFYVTAQGLICTACHGSGLTAGA